MNLRGNVDTVLFIVADSLRFDACSLALPAITKLATDNAQFTSFYTPGASTPSSMPGFFQSRSPIDHHGYGLELPPEIPTLPEQLADSGIECMGWHSNSYVGERYGFQRGFDAYYDLDGNNDETNDSLMTDISWRSLAGYSMDAFGMRDIGERIFEQLGRHGIVDINPKVRAKQAVDACLEWLPNSPDQSERFGYLHLMDTHLPYLPPTTYLNEQADGANVSFTRIYDLWQTLIEDPDSLSGEDVQILQTLYFAEARYMDDQIQRLVKQLQDRGLWESTALVFTGDHGELFRDRNVPGEDNVKHPDYLCEELTHTPLIIAGEPIPKMTDNTLTSGLDVAPTITGLFGHDSPIEWDGHAIGSKAYADREYIVSALAHTYGGGTGSRIDPDATHVAVRTDNISVLWWLASDRPTEYYYRTSKGERKVNPGDDDRFRHALDVAQEHGRLSVDVSEYGQNGNDVSDRLRDLGYIE